jgi:hypothetical protein
MNMNIGYVGADYSPGLNAETFDLIITIDKELPGNCKMAIERPGQERPYLAANGWQSNYKRFSIKVVPKGQGSYLLNVPVELSKFLDAEHNYRVDLFNETDGVLGFFGMNWSPPVKMRSPRPAPPFVQPEPQPVKQAEPALGEELPPVPPVVPDKPKTITRTVQNCRKCGGEIFSTLVVCPYCSTKV